MNSLHEFRLLLGLLDVFERAEPVREAPHPGLIEAWDGTSPRRRLDIELSEYIANGGMKSPWAVDLSDHRER